MNERRVAAQSPASEPASYQLTGPETTAAGIPAVVSSLRHVIGQAGPKKAIKLLRTLNQKGGVDCMSCAWPDPEKRSLAEFCENGAKAVADEGTLRRARPENYTVEELSRQSDYWLNQQGRLTQPLVLRAGSSRYQPIAWDEALDLIAHRLKSTHPDRNVFYTSGRTSNEAAFLYQLLARRHGTNNLPDCANLCHESSGVGLNSTLGVSKGTVTLYDFYQAQVIVIVGQNPGTNHPRMLSALQRAKKNGARIVSINPLPEAGLSSFKNPQDYMNPLQFFRSATSMADLHLPVTINGDVALFQWICRRLLEENKQEEAFIEAYTSGFTVFRHAVKNASLEGTGLTEKQVTPLVEWLSQTRRIVFCWAMGLTQHVNAVDNVKAIVNTCLLRGAIGHPGAGLCPVRGHSNVQGDRTMGITTYPKQAFLDRLGQHFKFHPPQKPGLDVVKAIQAMLEGKVDHLVCLGGNFLSACPDTELTAQALKNTKLTVQISTKLNRSHLVTGEEALILPCLGRTEEDGNQFVTVEDSMSIVHRSQGKQTPASPQLRSEIAIVCDLAGRLLDTDWSLYKRSYDKIRSEIEAVVPGFSDFNRRVRHPSGFALPILPRQGIFPTADGKAHFSPLITPDLRLPEGHFYMMTIRSHDQFNTTIYGNDDRYRGIHNKRRVLLMNPEDAARQRLRTGDQVDLWCEHRRADNFTVVTYPIPPGCTATYFPEANALVPLQKTAHGSNTPAYKSVIIRLEPRQ
ncbi:MAG: FdhF/YdeP family oxidoreductase [Candidatus Eremiobacteraeota bacterium]|nr:FdhF/YdeP family oxidoreductase [Candidatus Eremiobacteraeota bacterium]